MRQLLLPAASQLPRRLPEALARALGRADLDPADNLGAALARAFAQPALPWPVAALTRSVEGVAGEIAQQVWLRADPGWIQPDMNGARLMAVGAMLSVEAADVAALLPALHEIFDEGGVVLEAPTPERWYLRMPATTVLPAFSTPEAALGEDAFDHQPQGDAALVRRWRTLANEAQIVLHNHPHNAVRRAQGKPPINTLWFHGGGALPDRATSGFPMLWSDDPLLQALARLANMTASPLPAECPSMPEHCLIDLRPVPAHTVVDAWLLPALAQGGTQRWTFADGPGVQLAPLQRWRWWRKPLTRLDG